MRAKWSSCLIANLFEISARRAPDATAVLAPGRRQTYRELHERVARFGDVLLGLGVEADDRVALWLDDCPEYYEAYLGSAAVGAAHVPVLARLSAPEAAYQVEDSGATVLVLSSRHARSLAELPAADLPPRDRWLVLGPEHPDGTRDYETALAEASAEWPDRPVSEDGLGWIRYTSGTTGRPKGSVNTQRGWYFMCQTMNAAWHIDDRDVFLACSPVSHAGGTMGVNHLAVGAAVVVPEHPGPEGTVAAIQAHRATNLFMVPTQYALLLESVRAAEVAPDLSALRVLTAAGAPMSPALKARVAAALPGAELHEFYSATEAPMMTMLLPHEGGRKSDTVGRPRGSSRICVRDAEGREVPPGQVGKIWASSPMVHAGYWGREADPESHDGEFISVGDHGYLDPEGFLVLAGRESEMVISGGFNVYPREVEDALLSHPDVRDAAMFGLEDEVWGELVAAVVVTAPGSTATSEDLREWVRGRLAGYKVPRVLELIDEVPRAEGKVRRSTLRHLVKQ